MSQRNFQMYYCFLSVCFIQLSVCFGATVRTRFKLELLNNAPIRLFLPETTICSLDPRNKNENEAGHEVYRTFKAIFHIFNVTETYITHLESGAPDEYGNYSGLVGMVQRNEADAVVFMVRPDALPFEPVRIGPVLGSDEMVLMAARQPAKLKDLDVTYLFLNFDQLTYCYLVLCTYLVIVLLIAIVNCFEIRNYTNLRAIYLKAMLKHACNYCWSILELLVDQENYRPVEWSSRLIWLFYCTSSFILVFGFFTNLISTDMVALIKPPELHSLDDLFTPYFTPMNAMISTNLPSYGLIKHAKPSSSLGLLYERLNRNAKSSLITSNFDDFGSIATTSLNKLEDIRNGKSCVATTDYLLTVFRISVCTVRPNLWNRIYLSSSFAQGLMTTYYSKALPTCVAKYLDYKFRHLHELAVLGQLGLNTMKSNVAEKFQPDSIWTSFKCFHGMIDEQDNDDKATNIKLPFDAVRNGLLYGLYAFALAMFVLLIEYLMHLIKTQCTKKHTNAVRRRNERHVRNAQKWVSMQRQLTGRS